MSETNKCKEWYGYCDNRRAPLTPAESEGSKALFDEIKTGKRNKNKQSEIGRVAAGLRSMRRSPDYLLFAGTGDWVWDEPTVCGIPALHAYGVINTAADWAIPWLPLWRQSGEYYREQKQFNDGYEDHVEESK